LVVIDEYLCDDNLLNYKFSLLNSTSLMLLKFNLL
jgi:hypothetical protein